MTLNEKKDKNESIDSTLEKTVQFIRYHPKKRLNIFRELSIAQKSAVFNILSPYLRQEVLKKLSLEESVELLDHLDLRRAHHILDKMKNAKRRKKIIMKLKNDLHFKIENFLQFHPQASASLVNLNYVFLSEKTTIEETACIMEDYLHNIGKIPEIFVNKKGKLLGEVPIDKLVRENNSEKIGDYARPLNTVFYNEPQQEIINSLTSKPHKKIAILDADESVIGTVYSDDVIELLGESPASTLYSFAGVEESERPFDSVLSKVKHRYKWLILNLGTAFLAAGAVALFEDTIAQIVLLAIYMPVIAGMGGNASTQTLAIMVRGIAVGEITLKNSRPAIAREVIAGLINGLITGSLVAFIAIIFNQDPMLGVVVGLAVAFSLVIAGFSGTVIPLILRQMGKDPATSATIFITTATDVIGFLILLGLATLILL